ncbi:hypothetical protein [Spirillospora sp. NPDC029432]|uniref:hypothetical protein n=1 Tax=Spirillospora sp. NPDC029432 TaxID=3154599 RepID=UPI00345608C1
MRIRTMAGAAAAGAALATGAGLLAAPAQAAPAEPAQAAQPRGDAGARGKDCSIIGCSEVENFSGRKVRIGRDWCGAGSNGTVKNGTTACDGHTGSHPEKWLQKGHHSGWEGYFADTDTFGIIKGCTMKVQWNRDGSEGGDMKTYKASRHNRWVKVADNYDVDIESYKC